MQLSLLLLIAAVPLFGEAQMRKETNKEGRATRQENRKKIRKEELVPSCQTDSTSSTNERSDLLMELPNTAKLFGQPGTRHRIAVSVTNLGSVPIQLVLSHQEAFPLHPPDSVGTHVELVAGIQPEEVEVAARSSASVHVLITVSSYVPPLYRSKVTVSARGIISNQTEENLHRHHADISFYFTVVHPGASLADYDLTAPTCRLLCMDQCLPGNCQGWTARVRLQDKSTGLGRTKLVWPQEQNLVVRREPDWPFGTNQPSVLSIQAPCCQEGVLLEQSDLGGETVMCRIGKIATMGSSGKSISLLLLLCNLILTFARQ